MNTRIPSIELQTKFLEKLYTKSDIYYHLPILSFISSKVNSVTEMGVRGLVSTWAFLYGCPLTLVSIDLVNPTIHGQNLQEVYDIAIKNNINYNFIQGNTLEIEIEETDFLFIDTYHEYNHLKQELTKHASKVKKYIAFHDTVSFGQFGQNDNDALDTNSKGLNLAIDEFLEQNPQWIKKFEYTFSNGLVILERIKDANI
jgi:hypothetical protein